MRRFLIGCTLLTICFILLACGIGIEPLPDATASPTRGATATEALPTSTATTTATATATLLPGVTPTLTVAPSSTPTLTVTPTLHPATVTSTTAPFGPTPTRVVMVVWVIEAGDTLWGISRACGVPVDVITAWQPRGFDPGLLVVGQEIFVPGVETCE